METSKKVDRILSRALKIIPEGDKIFGRLTAYHKKFLAELGMGRAEFEANDELSFVLRKQCGKSPSAKHIVEFVCDMKESVVVGEHMEVVHNAAKSHEK